MAATMDVMRPDKVDLEEHDIFRGCSPSFLDVVSRHLEEKLYLPGQDICTQGDEGDQMFIMVHGMAQVIKDGVTTPVSVPPGSLFGEMSVLGIVRWRQATIKAQTVCLVEALRREVLLQAICDPPAEARRFEVVVFAHLEPTVHDAVMHSPFFAGCDPRVMINLSMWLRRWVALPGQYIVYKGNHGDSMYLINRGLCALFIGNVEVAKISEGEYFGASQILGVHR